MEGSPSGPDAGADSSGSGDSPLAAISGIAGKVRSKANERLGADAGARPRSGGGGAAGATVPAPPFEERPELYVGAAFAGGLVLAGVLRLLGR
jgi:hypothetical protein